MRLLLILTLILFPSIAFSNNIKDSLIINDEFKNNDNDWLEWDGMQNVKRQIRRKRRNKYNQSLKIKNGHYIMFNYSREDIYSLKRLTVLNPNKDFSLEVKIKQTDGDDDDNYGFIWGAGKNNYYKFIINSDQEYSIIESRKGKEKEQVDDEDCDLINPERLYNTLRIKRYNNKAFYYINDSLVFEQRINIEISNQFAFFIEKDITINIDYIKIWQDKEPINFVENPINGFEKVNLSDNVNSNAEEIAPQISADGNILYFVRDSDTVNSGTQEIWYSEKINDSTFSKAKKLGSPLNTKLSNAVVSISADKNKLFLFDNYLIDGKMHEGVAYSIKTKDGWSDPKRIQVEDLVNLSFYYNYSLSSDNNYLITSLDNYESEGNHDLFISFLENGKFTKPKNLGNVINSYETESSPFLAADNKTLYFSSEGHSGLGSADIFVSKRLDDTWTNWSKPKNLGSEVNSDKWDAYYTISASGEFAYLVSSTESNYSDIFRIKLTQDSKPEPVALVKGQIIDTKTQLPISANVIYKDIKTDSLIGTAISDPIEGKYQIALPMGRKYIFSAEKKGSYSISQTVFIDTLDKYQEIEQDLQTTPLEVGASILLNSIFFEYNKDELREESYSELNTLKSLLEKYPTMKIEIAGYTDDVGSVAYNKKLSGARAQKVYQYLLDKKVSSERISFKGYGEENPIAENSSEKGKAKNRRVEFIIIDN